MGNLEFGTKIKLKRDWDRFKSGDIFDIVFVHEHGLKLHIVGGGKDLQDFYFSPAEKDQKIEEYFEILNIEERQKTIVYICSPYRADTPEQLQKHIDYAKALSRKYVLRGYSVITPHLYYTSFLDDENSEEREIGLESARNLIQVCDMMIIGDECDFLGISSGMKGEIDEAFRLGKMFMLDRDFEAKNYTRSEILNFAEHCLIRRRDHAEIMKLSERRYAK